MLGLCGSICIADEQDVFTVTILNGTNFKGKQDNEILSTKYNYRIVVRTKKRYVS